MSRRVSGRRYGAAVAGLALVLGAIVAHRVIFEPGVVGLLRDWAVPPAPAQFVAFASHEFDGWYRFGLGFPVVYATSYPLDFLLAAAGAAGISGTVVSKAIIVVAPALAFGLAVAFARQTGMNRYASLACGAVYALNPVMLNKLVAGQQTYIVSYALFPGAFAAYAWAARRRRRVLGGIVAGCCLGLVSIQLQLGLLAALLLVLATFTLLTGPLRGRLTLLGTALATLVVIESAPIAGTLMNYGALLHTHIDVRRDVGWVWENSVRPFDALRLAGYITGFEVQAVRDWYALWSACAVVFVLAAIGGIVLAPPRVRAFAALTGLIAFVLVTGAHSPLGPVLLWGYEHVIFMQAFREVYDFMTPLALVYALGMGFFFTALARARVAPAFVAAAAVTIAVYLFPLLSGDAGGQLVAHPYGAEMTAAYRAVRAARGRVAWLPMDQPLSYRGSGNGVEPMGNTEPGSLWTYALNWPLTAVAMDARSADWSGFVTGLRSLSVAAVVERSSFRSELWDFVSGGDTVHYYLRRTLDPPPLGPVRALVTPQTSVDWLRDPLPLAFTADAVAIVPERLDAAAAAGVKGYVPLAFGTPPGTARYIVVRDPANADDEALAAAGFDSVPLPSTEVDARGYFILLNSWWWFAPAFSDAPEGVIAVGGAHYSVTIPRALDDGVAVVSWIATPLGGRVRGTAGGASRVFDTNAARPQWRSGVLPLGRIERGAVLRFDTVDLGGVVAIRAVRFVESSELTRARSAYADLNRSSAGVFAWAPSSGTFRPLRRGAAAAIGHLSFGRDYRLTLRYTIGFDGGLVVAGPGQSPLAFVPLRRGSHTATAQFAGIDGDALIEIPGGSVTGWSLRAADPPRDALAALPARPVTAGALNGTRATFAGTGNVVALNVAYGDNWRSADSGARHVASALGTNVWLLPQGARATAVDDRQTTLFHVTFALGSCLLAFGLLALAVGFE
jgi:hypothetical protein